MASNQTQSQQQQHRRMLNIYLKRKVKKLCLAFVFFIAMMNTYNDIMMSNTNGGPALQQDFHQLSPSLMNNNSLDLPYNHDIFMSPSPSGPQQQMQQNRHMNPMQSQQQPSVPPQSQAGMHQVIKY